MRTSSIDTPRSLAWARSMTSSSHGVSARKLVNSPCRCGSASPSSTTWSADFLQGRQAVVAGVLDDDLEAARRAQALDGRRRQRC